MPNKIHEGRNIKRIREMLGVKQETLAAELGLNQQKISALEQKEIIDPALLDDVARALKVPVEAIKNFSEEAAIFNIQHNYQGANEGAANVAVQNYQCTFNPIEKIVELYEALLKEKDEKMSLLERQMPSK